MDWDIRDLKTKEMEELGWMGERKEDYEFRVSERREGLEWEKKEEMVNEVMD